MADDRQRGGRGGGQASDELAALRAHSSADAAEIERLRSDGHDADRIERAQRALIARLRRDAEVAEERLQVVSGRLVRAESELGDLRAIRDALSSPALVQQPGLTLAAMLIPAAQVGGDFYFVGDGPAGAIVAVIGDVVGKGLQAARRAAFTRTAFASVAPFSDDPCQLLELVNVALVERFGESADFVTALCLTYNAQTRTLRLASAGHPPPLRLDSGSELPIPSTGRVLGIARTVGCRAVTEQLTAGDGVLLYTDGITEARGTTARYGTDRAIEAIREQTGAAPSALLAHLVDDVQAFAGDGQRDDICLVALRASATDATTGDQPR